MNLSIIIPVVNEEFHLKKLLPLLVKSAAKEVILVDGGSTDDSKNIAKNLGVNVIDAPKSRAKQMNAGAEAATGDVLYFIHADSIPPTSFYKDIEAHLKEDTPFGCFRSLFDTQNTFLRINSYFSRYKGMMFRGGGQSLWITKKFFQELNGYEESLKLMEEYDFIKRASQKADYRVIQKDVLVSTRTYDTNGNFKTQFIYGLIMFGFFRGINQDRLIKFGKRWLK